MMLIGHSIAQSVHLMHRSSSSRNIPRKRSEGIFFCSGYWIVTFGRNRCRPVTESPSKRSSNVSCPSHFFIAIRRSPLMPLRDLLRAARDRRQAIAPGQQAAQPGEQEHQDEDSAEDPGEDEHPSSRSGGRENGRR